MNRKITLEQEKQIIDLYKNKSQKNIGKLFGMTQGGVRKVLKRNHIIKLKNSRLNMSKLSLDVDFFKNVDSNEKAYWFGYIAADGSINKKNNKVTLVSKDKEIIEKFKICIKSDHKISETNVFDKRTKKRYRGFTIQIGNEIFTNNLINKGLTNLKSKKFNFPNIDDKYYSYLIAGLFDGDGCISFRRCKFKNKSRINLISTLENLVTIQNYLLNKINIKKLKLQKVSKYMWKMNLCKDSIKFLDFIYQNQNFDYLQRKYNLYLKYKENENKIGVLGY